jgi:hypothetical protein
VALEEVAGSSPVGHPPHEAAIDKRSGSSDAYSPNRVEGRDSEVGAAPTGGVAKGAGGERRADLGSYYDKAIGVLAMALQ